MKIKTQIPTWNFSTWNFHSRKKRDGPNRNEETLHSAAQEQNYQNRTKRPCIEEEDLTTAVMEETDKEDRTIRRPVPPAKLAAMRREQDILKTKIAAKENECDDPNNVLKHIG